MKGMMVPLGLLLLFLGGVIGIVTGISSVVQLRDYARQVEELSLRLSSSVERVDTFIIRDSIPVWRERIVEVDRTDYKEMLADKALIKDLELRVSEIESENRLLLSTRDTVLLEPLGRDSVVTYRDDWAFFSYDMTSGVLDWEVRDSLLTYVSCEYRHHFLWWKWGKKGYRVSHVNFNPHSRIEYSKFIKIKE